ncbi:MAG: hypothetical protein DHS20C03_08020 [Minwuia thermotolerans]|nr:MAG: hypothetical protein DHS20C03_08020 [Minwuia thermotolerans]
MLDFTPLLSLFARRRLEALGNQDVCETQHQQLLRLVRQARRTRFGQDHDLATVRSVADFQDRVPIRTYEDFWGEYWSPVFPDVRGQTWPTAVRFMATSSGTTTGRTKYLPVSDEMIRANKRAAIDIAVHHLANFPESRLLAGKTFMLGGSTAFGDLGSGIRAGDLSGIAASTQARWMRAFSFPPPELALMEDWEEKLETLARLSLKQRISMISGTPAWLLILFERLHELTGGAAPFPDLQLLVHGGVAWDLYRERFQPFLDQVGARTREVYPASEGFIAVADRGGGEGMRLIADNGIFFEFVPLSELGAERPIRHWVGNLEPGEDYAIVLTTNSGLFAYQIGDTVRFADRDPPRLLITGRTSYMLSAFGEHLIGEEIDRAVNAAARATGLTVNEYCVGPVLSRDRNATGHHRFIVETDTPAMNPMIALRAALFRDTIDRTLDQSSRDYGTHRRNGVGMGPPVLRFVDPGTFARWMATKGKAGGQNKVPRVIADPTRFTMMTGEIGAEGPCFQFPPQDADNLDGLQKSA